MLYHPELIVYLWLLPVTFLVVIPAALATCRFVFGCMKDAPVKIEEENFDAGQKVLAEA